LGPHRNPLTTGPEPRSTRHRSPQCSAGKEDYKVAGGRWQFTGVQLSQESGAENRRLVGGCSHLAACLFSVAFGRRVKFQIIGRGVHPTLQDTVSFVNIPAEGPACLLAHRRRK